MKVSFLLYFIPSVILSIAYLYYVARINPTDTYMHKMLENVMDIVNSLFGMLLMFTVIKILLIKRENRPY